jgi:hypothetical protein
MIDLIGSNWLRLPSTTVAALPSAVTFSGSINFVSDGSGITAVNQAVAGGGTQRILAWASGVTWRALGFE